MALARQRSLSRISRLRLQQAAALPGTRLQYSQDFRLPYFFRHTRESGYPCLCSVIPAKAGIHAFVPSYPRKRVSMPLFRHTRESGYPCLFNKLLDSRIRGNDDGPQVATADAQLDSRIRGNDGKRKSRFNQPNHSISPAAHRARMPSAQHARPACAARRSGGYRIHYRR